MCLPNKVSATVIQRIATIVGILTCLNFGLMFGITPSHMRLYQSTSTPLNRPVDSDAAKWVSNYLFIGCAMGALTSSFISHKIGPKSVLLLNGLLQMTGWFCIHFAYDIVHIYSSRLFAGVAAGAAFVVLPGFIKEISDAANCVTLTIYIDEARALGMLVGFVLGWCLPYEHVSIVGFGISFLFSMTFPFVQESPCYFMRKGNVSCMEKSLRWFRGIRQLDDREKPEFVRELMLFKAQMQDESIALSKMPRLYLAKIYTYSLLLALGSQLSGVFVILNYAEDIFAETASVYSFHINVLILCALHLVGAMVTAGISEHINRKILFFITSLLCGFSLISTALFTSFGNQWHLNPLYSDWLPLVFLSLQMLFANMGLYPLSTIIIREILPEKLYVYVSGVVVAISWLMLFLWIEFYNSLVGWISLASCFWFFAGVCIILSLFSCFFLPETLNRSSEDIQHNLGFVPSGSVAKIADIRNGHMTHDYI